MKHTFCMVKGSYVGAHNYDVVVIIQIGAHILGVLVLLARLQTHLAVRLVLKYFSFTPLQYSCKSRRVNNYNNDVNNGK